MMSAPAALDERALADAFMTGRVPDGEFTLADHPDLLGPSREFLLAHYAAATLDSELARRSFLLPRRP